MSKLLIDRTKYSVHNTSCANAGIMECLEDSCNAINQLDERLKKIESILSEVQKDGILKPIKFSPPYTIPWPYNNIP